MIDDSISELVFLQLKTHLENQTCFDCGGEKPQWASVNNGIFLCMTCAALHRSLGVNASFVRSLTMDQWSDKQLKHMALGGNKHLNELLPGIRPQLREHLDSLQDHGGTIL
jgi:hypothetical protein